VEVTPRVKLRQLRYHACTVPLNWPEQINSVTVIPRQAMTLAVSRVEEAEADAILVLHLMLSSLLGRRTLTATKTTYSNIARMSSAASDPSTYIFNHTMFRYVYYDR
jgi:hypothetical protein